MKTIKAYKVVSRDKDRNLWSCCSNPMFPSRFRTSYSRNKWATSPITGTGLFIFTDIEEAKHFVRSESVKEDGWRVYECEVRFPIRKQSPVPLHTLSVVCDVGGWKAALQNNVKIYRRYKSIRTTPAVKLIRMVR